MPRKSYSRKRSLSRKRTYGRKYNVRKRLRRSTKKRVRFGVRSRKRRSTKRRRIGSSKTMRNASRQTNRTRVSKVSAERSNSRLYPNKWLKGTPRGGPADRYVWTANATLTQTEPNETTFVFSDFGCNGFQVGTMLSNIRTETPYTLVGGAHVLQPTLFVRCLAITTIVNTGNSRVRGSYVVATPTESLSSTTAAVNTSYTAQYAASFDAVPSGYQYWPTSKIKSNYSFFKTPGGGKQSWKGKEVSFSILPGQPYNIKCAYSAKFQYADYATNTGTPIISLTSGGYWAQKSRLLILRYFGEEGQVCTTSDPQTYTLAPVGTSILHRTRHFYQYKWVAGNNRPTIYGSNVGPDTIIPITAQSFVGVPGLKAQRFVGGNSTDFGAEDQYSRQEAQINYGQDCAGTYFSPYVNVNP